MRRGMIVVLVVAMLAAWAVAERQNSPDVGAAEAAISSPPDRGSRRSNHDWPAFLPAEARDTLRLIEAGGPFEHRQDGGTFQNRERLLPGQPRGYYREYTVETPGSRDRGARRIVAGGDPPVEYFYTDDHYRSFRRFEPQGAQ